MEIYISDKKLVLAYLDISPLYMGIASSCLFRYTHLCCSWGSSDLALGTIVCDNNEKNIKRISEEIGINKRTLYSNDNQQMGRGVDTSRVRCS